MLTSSLRISSSRAGRYALRHHELARSETYSLARRRSKNALLVTSGLHERFAKRYLSTGENSKPPSEKKEDEKPKVSGAPSETKKESDEEEVMPERTLFVQLMETQYVWGFFSNFVAESLAQLSQLRFYLKRNGDTSKEICEKYGFKEDELLEGAKVAYVRIAHIFAKGEPVFQSQYSDLVSPTLAEMFDVQLEWFKRTKRAPRLIIGEVTAKLLFMDRGVPFDKMDFEEWTNRAREAQNKGDSVIYENIVPTVLYAHILFESNESFDWIPKEGIQPPESNMTKRKHMALFTADVPLGVQSGTEADNVEFKLERFS